MYVQYLVLQAEAEQGALARVRAEKLNRSWETLQAALDELGQQAGAWWRLLPLSQPPAQGPPAVARRALPRPWRGLGRLPGGDASAVGPRRGICP
jgi:hypothetical protein